MTTTVTLSAERFLHIEQLVAQGDFNSTDEAADHILAEALGVAPIYTVQELADLSVGCEDALRGEFVPQEETAAFFEDWKLNG